MDMLFDFDLRQGLHNVRFEGEGLDGSEEVTSLKQALGLMKIRNPAATFRDALQALKYDDMTDMEYGRLLEHVKWLSTLWRYPDDPKDAQQKYEMNALMLLANALELLCK